MGQYVDPAVRAADRGSPTDITIGEALEATAYTAAGEKPVDQSDAAAINVAEVRALGSNDTPSSGIGAYAQSAADHNARLMRGGNKTTLSDVLAVTNIYLNLLQFNQVIDIDWGCGFGRTRPPSCLGTNRLHLMMLHVWLERR